MWTYLRNAFGIYMSTAVLPYMCMYGGQRPTSGVFLTLFFRHSWRQTIYMVDRRSKGTNYQFYQWLPEL